MPRPVSRTRTCTFTPSPSCGSGATSTVTSPRSVNLIELPTRLRSTCPSRPGSPTRPSGTSGATRYASSSPLACASGATVLRVSATVSRSANGTGSNSRRPASILEKSRMSLITPRSASPERRTVSAYSRCSASSGDRVRRGRERGDPVVVAVDLPAVAGIGQPVQDAAAQLERHPAAALRRVRQRRDRGVDAADRFPVGDAAGEDVFELAACQRRDAIGAMDEDRHRVVPDDRVLDPLTLLRRRQPAREAGELRLAGNDHLEPPPRALGLDAAERNAGLGGERPGGGRDDRLAQRRRSDVGQLGCDDPPGQQQDRSHHQRDPSRHPHVGHPLRARPHLIRAPSRQASCPTRRWPRSH